MPYYKLTYFDVRAMGEPIRFMLSYMRAPFGDIRVMGDEWLKMKKNVPFGKVPILEIDGKVYHQSAAICRYLAIEAGLSGDTPLENLIIDQTVGAFNDFTSEVATMFNTQDAQLKENLRKTVIEETIPFYLSRFDRQIGENSGYLANSKLSWADLYVVGYSESLPAIFTPLDPTNGYPNFQKLQERVRSLEGISEWIKSRPVSFL